jgi:U3 small nucleolar RNA-associated protein 13
VIAHAREINAIAVSRDGSVCATGSADKTGKLWGLKDNQIIALRTLTGHKRGIDSVAFSPTEKVVATGSKDHSIKLWSTEDGACLSSFTEFQSSIVNIGFICEGLQIIAAESRGSITVVRVKTGAPDLQLEEAHSGTIWGFTLRDKELITGAVDGKICIWKDNTEQLALQEQVEKAENALAEQELTSSVRNGQFVAALRLAFRLRMPGKLRSIVRGISENDSPALLECFDELTELPDWEQWVDYAVKWCTNSRWADDATDVIAAMLKVKQIFFFIENRRAFEGKIEALISYLERHVNRLDRLNIQSYTIDDVIEVMNIE